MPRSAAHNSAAIRLVSNDGTPSPDSAPQDLESRLSASGALVLPFDEALRAIDELTRRGMRLDNWEGWIVRRNGTRIKSLQAGGSFALSRDPARAAQAATAGITRARQAWERKPEYDDGELHFALSFSRV